MSSDPQRGHATVRRPRATGTGPPTGGCLGGAIPNRRSFSLPSSDIQSVVHAGLSRVVTRGSQPAARQTNDTCAVIASIAGQPE